MRARAGDDVTVVGDRAVGEVLVVLLLLLLVVELHHVSQLLVVAAHGVGVV